MTQQNTATCPFSSSHKIHPNKLLNHIVRCKDGLKMRHLFTRCRYSVTHYVRKEEIEEHERNCVEREEFKKRMGLMTEEKKKVEKKRGNYMWRGEGKYKQEKKQEYQQDLRLKTHRLKQHQVFHPQNSQQITILQNKPFPIIKQQHFPIKQQSFQWNYPPSYSQQSEQLIILDEDSHDEDHCFQDTSSLLNCEICAKALLNYYQSESPDPEIDKLIKKYEVLNIKERLLKAERERVK